MPDLDPNQELTESLIKEMEPSGEPEPKEPEPKEPGSGDEGEGEGDEEQGELDLEDEGIQGEEGEEGEEEGEEPVSHVPPPMSLSAEELTHFQSLSPEMQNFVSRRDAERDVYFQRTQNELAADRKEVEAMRGKWSEQLNLQANSLAAIVGKDTAPPDPALRNTDPEAYDDQMATYVHSVHQQKQAQVRLDEVKAIQNSEVLKYQDAQAIEVVRLIPEMGDPIKGPQLQSQIQRYAEGVGYSRSELAGANARDAVILHKAMMFDNLKSSGKKVVDNRPRKAAPKVAKSGASKGVGNAKKAKTQQLRKRLKAGDDKAMVGLFQMQLESEGY